jgi:threonine/homoserine efflux transporter RhtA
MRLYADAAAVAGVLILTGVLSGIWVYIYCGAGLAVVASSLFAWPYLSGVSVSRRAGERSSRVGAGYGSTVQAPSQDSSS